MKEGGFLYNQNWNANVPNYGYNRNQNLDWIIVPTVDQIAQVTVQPNQRAWIMAQNEPVFALRSADSMGLVNTEYYRFEKMNSNALNVNSNALDALERRIDALERMINNESINANVQ